MPIYEYQCSACGHQLEAIQKISDMPLKLCPECHKESLQKLISAAGFQLKGTGWYETDFKNKGKPEAKSKDTEVAKNTTVNESKTNPTSTGKDE